MAEALSRKGWQLHTQVGASRFRIDLAVVHPDAPGAYLCGLECDGATYHRSATARDRDKLREQVLRGLGWEIVRIWSTDWWINPADTLAKVDAQLHALLTASQAQRARDAEALAARIAAAEAEAQAAIAKAQEETMLADGEGAALSPGEAVAAADPAPEGDTNERADGEALTEDSEPQLYARSAVFTPASETQFAPYVEAYPRDAIEVEPDPEAFFDAAYNETLDLMIEHVARIEGPVLDELLVRRIARAHGWQRNGARIMERVTSRAARLCPTSYEATIGTFFWPPDAVVGAATAFRRPGAGVTREVDEICMAELKSLAEAVGSGSGASDPENSMAQMARALGLARMGASRRQRLEAALSGLFGN